MQEETLKLLSVVTAVAGLVALVGAIVLLVLGVGVPEYLWFIALAGAGLGGGFWPTKPKQV